MVLIAVALIVLFLASRVIRVRDVFGALDAEWRWARPVAGAPPTAWR